LLMLLNVNWFLITFARKRNMAEAQHERAAL
jgi:hypothetical protein